MHGSRWPGGPSWGGQASRGPGAYREIMRAHQACRCAWHVHPAAEIALSYAEGHASANASRRSLCWSSRGRSRSRTVTRCERICTSAGTSHETGDRGGAGGRRPEPSMEGFEQPFAIVHEGRVGSSSPRSIAASEELILGRISRARTRTIPIVAEESRRSRRGGRRAPSERLDRRPAGRDEQLRARLSVLLCRHRRGGGGRSRRRRRLRPAPRRDVRRGGGRGAHAQRRRPSGSPQRRSLAGVDRGDRIPVRPHGGHRDNNLGNLNRFILSVRGIRRGGSAELDLAYVACGRLDGFWELGLKIWDVSAGGCIVREAGGTRLATSAVRVGP